MLFLLLGLLGLIVNVVVFVALHSFTSFDLTGFSLFYVVPVGSILIGALSSVGYYFGILKSNKKTSNGVRWIGILIALVSFVAIQYGYYFTAYLDDHMNLNYKMEEEHVSNFVIVDTEEEINFISFTKECVNSRSMSFSNRGRQFMEVEGNKIVNWIFYGMHGLIFA